MSLIVRTKHEVYSTASAKNLGHTRLSLEKRLQTYFYIRSMKIYFKESCNIIKEIQNKNIKSFNINNEY